MARSRPVPYCFSHYLVRKRYKGVVLGHNRVSFPRTMDYRQASAGQYQLNSSNNTSIEPRWTRCGNCEQGFFHECMFGESTGGRFFCPRDACQSTQNRPPQAMPSAANLVDTSLSEYLTHKAQSESTSEFHVVVKVVVSTHTCTHVQTKVHREQDSDRARVLVHRCVLAILHADVNCPGYSPTIRQQLAKDFRLRT